MRVPIACTLSADAVPDRVEEWRAFLAADVEDLERTDPECLRLRLRQSEGALVRAADLAQREKACCAFFDFAIEVQSDALWLVVRVPPDAAPVLADLESLLASV